MHHFFALMTQKSVVQQVADWTHHPELLKKNNRFDARAFRILVLLLMLSALNIYDLNFTLFAHRIGMLDERNPIAESFLALGLERSLISFKLLMLLVACVTLWKLRQSVLAIWACWLLMAVYVGLGLMWYEWTEDLSEAFDIFGQGMQTPVAPIAHVLTGTLKASGAM